MRTLMVIAAAGLFAGFSGCCNKETAQVNRSAYGYGDVTGSTLPAAEGTAPVYVYGTPNITATQPVTGAGSHLVYSPDDVRWLEAPMSMPRGASMAILEGDPSSPSMFTMRLMLPDGYRVAPHTTPDVERITVLSGVLKLGEGQTFEPAGMQTLPPGGYAVLGPATPHYIQAVGDTVIQITTMGPFDVRYVDPREDPRNR